jgi:hypothetical protein
VHLEFAPYTPPAVSTDVVVLAGDIDVGCNGVAWAAEHFPTSTVLYVLGNHEYYRQAHASHIARVKKRAKGTNVVVLENDAVVVDDTLFLGCTLWTDFNLFGDPEMAGRHAGHKMNDYRKIRLHPVGPRLRPGDTARMHRRSRTWLAEQLQSNRPGKTVVVTHHAPSKRSLAQCYSDDLLSAAYASAMDSMVADSGARLWIHGHVHVSQNYMIGGTRIICNPRGYPEEANDGFAADLVVEI